MPGFKPQIECLVKQPSRYDENFLWIVMRFSTGAFCIRSGMKAGNASIFATRFVDTESEFFNAYV